MRVGSRFGVAIAVAIAFLCSSRSAATADERSPKTRAAALQAAVQEWCKTREALVGDCPACQGRGYGYNAKFECPTCKGRKLYVGVAQWQALHWDVLSPAKRAKLKLTEVKAARDAEDPVRARMKDCRFDRVELVGDFFGRAWVFEEKAEVSKESRWVEVLDVSAKKPKWFLWSEDTDGPWPGETPGAAAAAAGAAAAGPVVTQPLKPDELLLVRGKVALVETKLSLEDAMRDGGTLVMVFSHPNAADSTALELDTAASVVALTTAGLDALKDVPAVRLVVLAKWRDKFGEVRKRPYRTIEMSRETYGRIHFDRLSREEQLSHFTVVSPKYEGEILWWKD